MIDYDWLPYGALLLRFDNRTVFMQGEEAAELYDQCEACETSEELELLLYEYADLAEEEV